MSWAEQKAALAAAVRDAFGEEVTITFYTPGSYNATTGKSTPTTAPVTCSATRSPDRLLTGGGDAQAAVREVTFKVAKADIGANVPSRNDTVTDGDGKVWYVASTGREVSGAMVVLTCRNMKL